MSKTSWLFWIVTGFLTASVIQFFLSHPGLGNYAGPAVFALFLVLGGMDYLGSQITRQKQEDSF